MRHVHLGLGSFFRAHQAWFTHRADDGDQWGIAAFSGRSADLARRLDAQDGLYTLATREPGGETYEVIGSLVAAHAAADGSAWLAYLADPTVVVLTTTVTEAGYLRGGDGGLDRGRPDVAADLAALRDERLQDVTTVPGRLVAGLVARCRADAGPLAVVPCDNLPGNGAAVRRVVLDLAVEVSADLATWITEQVSFVTTMVDRITPEPTAEDVARVAAGTGLDDPTAVVTEPFAEWVLCGSFPGGRPAWESAGATFTDDVARYEARKLGLLNGAHSLLAYLGSLRGHAEVAEAVADPLVRATVDRWWDEASSYLDFPADEIAGYRAALIARFANQAIHHRLEQIGADGSQKLPVRIVPTLRRELAAGRAAPGATTALAAWIASLRTGGVALRDARSDEVAALALEPLATAVQGLLRLLDPPLAGDERLVAAVVRRVQDLA
ncbi:mannitol dehydrogenase family protein [Paraoerskovia sediminicola]|uniref:mannitol dehydrogenase family protein n=1 Tax=Paraoerskovia sediminicola TaxID=1138587 RepID=UPI002572D0AC|nr:mannitol dehydrogenase family protein [Paraoerskovia sediminicola]